MIVDADVSRIRAMHAALSADFQVVQATTGERARHLAQLAVPDLMLIDIALPDMDGFALAEALRAEPATRALAVLLLCDPGLPRDADRARALGLPDLPARPVDPARLHRTVSALTRPAVPEAAPPDATIARLAAACAHLVQVACADPWRGLRARIHARPSPASVPNGMNGSLSFAQVDEMSDAFAAFLRHDCGLRPARGWRCNCPTGWPIRWWPSACSRRAACWSTPTRSIPPSRDDPPVQRFGRRGAGDRATCSPTSWPR
jgi:CheY-like chemotaxis protein